MPTNIHLVWGPELSPFLLKLEALLSHQEIPFRRMPRDGSRWENIALILRINRAKRTGMALRPPATDRLDEYPLVPFLVTPDGAVLYDTTALAAWMNDRTDRRASSLFPEDPALRFVCAFLDEAFDEFGLYMVHHNRWKLAAGNNDHAGHRLAREFKKLHPPGSSLLLPSWFEKRQVRRLPYLFSVAPEGYRVAGLPPRLTPPSRPGFPPTHALLDQSWERCLAAMEALLGDQPFLLGNQFTLADASAYGQLSMNLTDTAAAQRLRQLAPRCFAWLESIRDQKHVGATGELRSSPLLTPLLQIFLETFAPLMRANEAAYEREVTAGDPLFNEKAFDAGRALFDVEVAGHPCRTVVKTFQVRVWRDLRTQWQALSDTDRLGVGQAFGDNDPNRSALGNLFRQG